MREKIFFLLRLVFVTFCHVFYASVTAIKCDEISVRHKVKQNRNVTVGQISRLYHVKS